MLPGSGGNNAKIFDLGGRDGSCRLRDDHKGHDPNNRRRYARSAGRGVHNPNSERTAGRNNARQRNSRQIFGRAAHHVYERMLRGGIEHDSVEHRIDGSRKRLAWRRNRSRG